MKMGTVVEEGEVTIGEVVTGAVVTGAVVTGADPPAAATTVLYAFTRPQPNVLSKPAAPRSSAFLSRSVTRAWGVNEGLVARASAATPETTGVASDVPHHMP